MRRIFTVLFLLFTLSVLIARADDETWTRVAPNNYVNEDTIVGLDNKYGFSFLLKAYNKGQYEPVRERRIFYTLAQYEMDCLKKTYKIGVIDSYDENDIFVNGDYNRFAQFQPIVSGTAVSVLYKKLCRP